MTTPTLLPRGRPSNSDLSDRLASTQTVLDDLRLDLRVLRLEGTQFANDVRLLARYVQRLGISDGSPETVQLGVQLEHRAERHLRQRR
jgi:hypothetical protein